jgi:hypothetical protein
VRELFLDQIKDAQVMRLIERIGEHYRTNISNRFIRPALLQLPLDKTTWDNIETLTEKYEQFRYQGFHLDELYREVAATARFVAATRREVAPSLRSRLNNGSVGTGDKVLRDMAVNTFTANLNIFADLLKELYVRLVDIDVGGAKGKTPLYQQVPEYGTIEEMLQY